MYLFHKNKLVAKLTMFQEQPIGIEEIYNQELLPVGLRGDLDFADKNFLGWNSERVIPAGRVNIDTIRGKLGNPVELSTKSLGLSLTDCYWFNPVEKDGFCWEDVNFHENGFESDLLLLRKGQLHAPHRSPDYTTGGVLDKFWFHSNGRSYLAKIGTIPGVQEEPVLAANEVVASKIANRLNIPCTEYQPILIDNEFGCVSECFAKKDENVVTAQSIAYQLDTYDANKVIDYIRNLGFGQDLDKMFLLDAIIGNNDAHLSNFALGMNCQTMEYTRFIPLYDNGSSLGWNRVRYQDLLMKPFQLNPDRYIQMVNTYTELPRLDDLLVDLCDVYDQYHISEQQTSIAMQTLTDGYQTVQNRMLELELEDPEYSLR